MITSTHDIYDPPPAPTPLAPTPDRLVLHAGDLSILTALCVLACALAAWAWTIDPAVGAMALIGGGVVIVESFSTALGFLHRRPWMGERGRWKIFVAALVPWLLGLAAAAGLMVGLFRVADRYL